MISGILLEGTFVFCANSNMKISQNWIADFVTIPKKQTPEDVALALTTHSFEIDSVHQWGPSFAHMVLGQVESIEKHPNADRLSVCLVNDGSTSKIIVCGGSNLVVGMKVALATAGAKVRWHGEGDLIELADVKIRGVESQGMICAAEEIGLATGHEVEGEIMDLSAVDSPIGTPLHTALHLDDVTYDIDNKAITNRPDCWGAYGVAREVAAIYETSLKPYTSFTIPEGSDIALTVKNKAPKLCRRYMGLVISGVKASPSPQWMQARLRASGVRSINTVVDVTNYVMLELGQPMHAFDLNLLETPEIIVRTAQQNEAFVPLGREEIALDSAYCVIADKKQAIALAGVKGGEGSGIKDGTTTIVLEAANFDPTAVRKAAQQYDLRTDSSSRFEKSLDPTLCEMGIRRAVELLLQLHPEARVISKLVDVGKWSGVAKVKPITLDLAYMEQRIGAKIPVAKAGSILKRLGFDVTKKKGSFVVDVPSWRATKDVSIAEDLIEEVARIYGYDAVQEVLPDMPITPAARDPELAVQSRARSIVAGKFGFVQTMSYSFVSEATIHALDQDIADYIAIANPQSTEQTHLRRNLIPNMLHQLAHNMKFEDAMQMFELGRVFLQDQEGELEQPTGTTERLPHQPVRCAGVVSEKGNETPFVQAKAAALGLLDALGVSYRTEPGEHFTNWMHPGRSLTIYIGDERVGDVSELHPAYMDAFDLEHRVGFFDLDLTAIAPHIGQLATYTPLPKFPVVKRDLAFVLPEHSRYDYIVEALETADPMITDVELFDVYRGKGVEANYKSMAFHLHFSNPDRTLTAQEVDAVYKKLVKLLEEKFKISVRS